MEPKSFLIHFYSQKQERKCLYILYRKWSLSWYCHKWFLLGMAKYIKIKTSILKFEFLLPFELTLAMFISYIWQKARDKRCQREFKWENNHIFKGVFFAVSFFSIMEKITSDYLFKMKKSDDCLNNFIERYALGNRRPIHLYLIFEKSSSTHWIF